MPEVQTKDLKTDVHVTNHHSILLVLPLTDRAAKWISENVQDDAQWFGRSLVVEPRYLADLCRGMEEDGLVIDAAGAR